MGRVWQVTNVDGTKPITCTYSHGKDIINQVYYLEKCGEDAKQFTTCARNELVGKYSKELPPTGPGVTYSFDEADRLAQVSRGGADITLLYDMAGRKTQINDPDMGTWKYTYDALSNLMTQTDARCSGGSCVTTSFTYDDLNHLTKKEYSIPGGLNVDNTSTVNYYYWNAPNGTGARVGMTDGSGWTTWGYDSRGRVINETNNINETNGGTFLTQWSYNSADLVTSIIYPGGNAGQAGEQVYYTYYPQMALNSMTGESTYVQSSLYDEAGRMTQRVLGDQKIEMDLSYYDWIEQNGAGRLENLYAKQTDPINPLQNLSYTYDEVGNIATIVDAEASGQVQTFQYDELNRLVSASASGGDGLGVYSQGYGYDIMTGNLSSKTGMGDYGYNDPIHKHAVTHLSGVQKFWYDANGNMTTRVAGSTYTLKYDAENRMTKVNDGVLASFVYDGDGRRVKATDGGITVVYIGDYYEWRGANAVKKYYYAGGQRVAMRVTDGGSINLLSWMVGDHLGSTAMVTDDQGANGIPQRYKAWGEVRPGPGNGLPTDYTFTGQQKVESIGLMFYNARWYDAALGRFIQADSIVPGGGQGLDRYAYVNNSPTNFTDPSGHRDPDCKDWGDCGYHGDKPQKPAAKPVRKIEMPIPDGLNVYGVNAWQHIQELIDYAKRTWGIDLTVVDILALVIAMEYLGQIGPFKEWAQLIAKAYHTYCDTGAFSADCMNNFWGYMQIFLGDYSTMYSDFDYWFERKASKSNLDLAREIANVILHHITPNAWGIDDSKCKAGDRCNWHELKKGESYKGFTWASLMNSCPQESKPSPGAQFIPCRGDIWIYGSYDEQNKTWAIDFIYR